MDLDTFGKEKKFILLNARFKSRPDQNARDICAYVDAKRISVSPRRLLELYLKLGAQEPLLHGKDFRDLKKEDLAGMFAEMRERPGRGKRKISVRSVNNYKDELKSFMKFLGKNDVAAEIKKDRMTELNRFTAEDMLDAEDVAKLLRAAPTARDRAIIAVLAETGMRPSELFNLQIKDVNLTSQVNRITIFGKKRKRVRPIVACIPYITEWLNKHPAASNPDAALFVKGILEKGEKEYQPLPYHGVLQMIRRTFMKAGIKKPAILKLFRHSANTFLYGNFSEEVVRQLQGHVPGSQMARHYSHLNSQRVSDTYLSIYGIKPQEEAKPLLSPRKCQVCGFDNTSEKLMCDTCKRPLSLKSAMEMTSPNTIINDALAEDSGLLKQLEDRIAERIIKQVEERLSGQMRDNATYPFEQEGKYGAAVI